MGGSQTNGQFVPPPGPPPPHARVQENSGHHSHEENFSPPPGPPPSRVYRQGQEASYLPPPGPPPSYQEPQLSPSEPSTSSESHSPNPPPYHDWTIIPDTSLLPPPPPLPQDYSPTNNASYDSAARAHEWCARHPVYTPVRPSRGLHLRAQDGHLTFERPPARVLATGGKGFVLQQLSPSAWTVRTSTSQRQDLIVLSSIPLYFAAVDTPAFTGRQKTIYFEIVIKSISDAHSGVAIGFSAKPYPAWRLPGWHRASIGVHGDDGRRFVNDSWGGRDFVPAFRRGETVGLGMAFSTQVADAERGTVKTMAFLTRNGQRHEAWEWNIDEERDERDEGVEGLMGEGDLYPSIGMFGGVQFDVVFGDGLMWRPRD